jgi:hypothetical protein
MSKAATIRTASPICAATGVFPQVRPFRAVTLYGIAAHLRLLASREKDAARRRELERRERAVACKAREVLRNTVGRRP